MKDGIIKFISIVLAIISIIILTIFLQNLIYNGKPFTISNYRLLIVDKDNKDLNINKDDLIIVNEKDINNIKENTIISYTLNEKDIYFGTVKNINDEGSIEVAFSPSVTHIINNDLVIGTYQFMIKHIGKYISYLRTFKGFILSIGIIFAILLVITSISKITLFTKKLFTKKY